MFTKLSSLTYKHTFMILKRLITRSNHIRLIDLFISFIHYCNLQEIVLTLLVHRKPRVNGGLS